MRNFILIVISVFLFSCGQQKQQAEITVPDSEESQKETIEKAKNIFYNMYLPSEMYKVFDMVGVSYDVEVLNPIENVNSYTTSSKAALNLGIYGVDLSYNKLFNQSQKTLLYLTVIHKLSLQLGIPDEKFAYALKHIHKNISNRDSLTFYASDIYTNINTYLSENDRQSVAVLILAGGWIEALYIASEISESHVDNREIFERIIVQKYSLKYLLTLLKLQKSDASVAEMYNMFQDLKLMFDNIELDYSSQNISIDTLNLAVNAKKLKIDVSQEEIDTIFKKIRAIRSSIVD